MSKAQNNDYLYTHNFNVLKAAFTLNFQFSAFLFIEIQHKIHFSCSASTQRILIKNILPAPSSIKNFKISV